MPSIATGSNERAGISSVRLIQCKRRSLKGTVDLSILEASLKVTKKLRKMQHQKAKDGDLVQFFCDLRCRGTNNEY